MLAQSPENTDRVRVSQIESDLFVVFSSLKHISNLNAYICGIIFKLRKSVLFSLFYRDVHVRIFVPHFTSFHCQVNERK